MEAIKEKSDVELLILNNINPAFRQFLHNEAFPLIMDDYARMGYIVDLMYLEDKYKDDLPLMYKKMECEAEYARADIASYIILGDEDEHEFIHKYSNEWKKEHGIPTSDCEEEEDSDEDMESSDSDDSEDDEVTLHGCKFTAGLMNVIEEPKTKEDGDTEDVCTYQIVYLKNMCFPPFKPDPNKNYFVNFPAL